MKIVQLEEVPLVRGLEHRGGTFHSRTLVEGQPGTPGNFKFSLSKLGTDYSGPRHRHNFDQYRFMIEGHSDYGQDGPVKAGMQELKKFGEFKDGVFRRHDDVPGKRNMDAYQAIWEHVHGREMIYPKGRYDAPIMMDSANYDWALVKGTKGVSEKLFGVWTERRTQAGLIKLDAGASHEVGGHGIYFVLEGAGECAGQPLQQYTTVYLEDGERAALRASETTELLHYGLPDLSGIAAAGHTSGVAM